MKHFLAITLNGSYGYERGDQVPVKIIGGSRVRVKVEFRTAMGQKLVRSLAPTSLVTQTGEPLEFRCQFVKGGGGRQCPLPEGHKGPHTFECGH